MRNLIALVLAASVASSSSAQALGYQFSSNGKNYGLAFADVVKPKKIKDWADVTYSVSPVVGSEVGGPVLFGGGAWIRAEDHNWHAFVQLNLCGLFSPQDKPVGVFGVMAGFSFPVGGK